MTRMFTDPINTREFCKEAYKGYGPLTLRRAAIDCLERLTKLDGTNVDTVEDMRAIALRTLGILDNLHI